jgi:hypothetical protein
MRVLSALMLPIGVIPAKAGIHVDLSFIAQMDPGLRRMTAGC